MKTIRKPCESHMVFIWFSYGFHRFSIGFRKIFMKKRWKSYENLWKPYENHTKTMVSTPSPSPLPLFPSRHPALSKRQKKGYRTAVLYAAFGQKKDAGQLSCTWPSGMKRVAGFQSSNFNQKSQALNSNTKPWTSNLKISDGKSLGVGGMSRRRWNHNLMM